MAQHPGVIEALDAPAEASKGASVLARLAEREEQRAATAVERLEELQVSSDPRESVDAFMEDFSTRRQQLEAALQACATPGNAAPHDQLTALGEQLAALEKVRDWQWHPQVGFCWWSSGWVLKSWLGHCSVALHRGPHGGKASALKCAGISRCHLLPASL
jgi:hypothetical protein